MTPPSTANPSPPACLWLKPAGLPLTQARRIAADSSSPDCRWLMPAGRRWQGKPTRSSVHAAVCGSPTPPFAGDHAAVHGESQPTVGGCLYFAGKANPPSAVHSARSRLRLPPARRPLPLSGQASRLLPLLSSQPVMVSPAGRCRIDKPAGRGRNWPDGDHGLFNYCVCVCLAPEGSWYPWATPWYFFGGGTKVPAVVAGPRDEATATMDHRPWPPELPAPPWPPSICSTLEVPSCVCIHVCPEGPPECPPPLPGGTVTARVEPSGRGELC